MPKLAVFPKTEIQNFIIHQICNSARYVSYKDLKALVDNLKAVYAEVDENVALDALEIFSEHWNKKYPKISISRKENWPNLSTYFKYPQEVRRLIYTTNVIEGFKHQMQKVTKAKSTWARVILNPCVFLALQVLENILVLLLSVLRDIFGAEFPSSSPRHITIYFVFKLFTPLVESL